MCCSCVSSWRVGPCLWNQKAISKIKMLETRPLKKSKNSLVTIYEEKTSDKRREAGEGIMSQSGQPPKKINVYHEQTQQPSEIQANALLDPSETQSNALLEESMQLKKFMPDPENLEDFVPLATPSTERSSKKRERNSFDEIEKESVLKLKRPREEKKGHFFSIYETCLEDMTESEKSKLHMDILKSISEIKGSRPQAVPIFVHGNETNIV